MTTIWVKKGNFTKEIISKPTGQHLDPKLTVLFEVIRGDKIILFETVQIGSLKYQDSETM